MKADRRKFFIFVNLIFLFNSFNSYYLAQTKQNSIIKLFCIQSIKEEMFKAEMEYSEEIAIEACECYHKEFAQTSSHQDAKTICKLEAKDKFESF